MRLAPVVVLALGLGACRPGGRAIRAGDLTIRDLRATAAPDSDGGTVYFTVRNEGARPDTLLEVTVDSAPGVLHTMERAGGMMRMVPAGPVGIGAGATLRLHTGGTHLMFSEVRRRIGLGDTISVTLRFAGAGTVTIAVAVGPYSDQ